MIVHGIDIIEIERIQHAIARHGQRFLQRVYTHSELERYQANIPSLAARWAAKEATAKLFGVGLRGLGAGVDRQAIGFHDIEILSDPTGRPIIRLYGAAQQHAKQQAISDLTLSLSHTRTLAIASIVGVIG
jgi:holo-[acyl-carrier protein] synthase